MAILMHVGQNDTIILKITKFLQNNFHIFMHILHSIHQKDYYSFHKKNIKQHNYFQN